MSIEMKKGINKTLTATIIVSSIFATGAALAEPTFHSVLQSNPTMTNYLYSNQIQQESKVSDVFLFTFTPGC